MIAQKRRHSICRRPIASGCVALLPYLLNAFPAFAQEYDHMRVHFGHDAAWTQSAPRSDFSAPLPPGPARPGYGYARNDQSGATQDRVRLKASVFNGM
jgi:hypothetical protein